MKRYKSINDIQAAIATVKQLQPKSLWITTISLYKSKVLKTHIIAKAFRTTLTGEEGFEPPWTVLETAILPLYDSPINLYNLFHVPYYYTWNSIYLSIHGNHFLINTLYNTLKNPHRRTEKWGQALDRLVTVSSIHCCTSTSALSTLYSSRGLTS